MARNHILTRNSHAVAAPCQQQTSEVQRYATLLLLGFIMLVVPLLTHATDIRGRVDRINPITHQTVPYANASVKLWQNNRVIQQTSTGWDGFYYMRNLRPGRYMIQVSNKPRITIFITSRPAQDINPILVR